MRFGFTVWIAIASLLLALAPAGANAERVDRGWTRMKLTRGLYGQLVANGVRIGTTAPARSRGRVAAFEVGSGSFESTYGSGYFFLDGRLVLTAGTRTVRLTDVLLQTSKKVLRAGIGGKPVNIAVIPGEQVANPGFGTRIASNLVLTRRGAGALNRLLGLRGVFRPGRLLARSVTLVRPILVGVSGGTSRLTFDPGFTEKLDSLDVVLSAQEAATLTDDRPRVLSLPVLPGIGISPDLSQGLVSSEDGFALAQAGDPPKQVRILGLSIHLSSNALRGLPGFPSGNTVIGTVDFGDALPEIDYGAGTIETPGRMATLDADIARKLNETFAAPRGEGEVFAAGEPLGHVSFLVRTR